MMLASILLGAFMLPSLANYEAVENLSESCPGVPSTSTQGGVSLMQAAKDKIRIPLETPDEAELKQETEQSPGMKLVVNTDGASAEFNISSPINISSYRGGAFVERMRTRFRSLCESLQHEAAWFARDISQHGVSRQSSGVVVLLVLILLMIAVLMLAWQRSSHRKEHNQNYAGGVRLSEPDRESPRLSQLSHPHSPGAASSLLGTPNSMSRMPGSGAQDPDDCSLVVPSCCPDGAFDICDRTGDVVLHAFARRSQGASALWRLQLRTSHGAPFAECQEMLPSTAGNVRTTGTEFSVLDGNSKYFARLVQLELPRGQKQFQLTTQTGEKLKFWGNFESRCVNASDEQGGLFATTEPYGSGDYCLRVAHAANAGLPLCALLCIGQMQAWKSGNVKSGAIV